MEFINVEKINKLKDYKEYLDVKHLSDWANKESKQEYRNVHNYS